MSRSESRGNHAANRVKQEPNERKHQPDQLLAPYLADISFVLLGMKRWSSSFPPLTLGENGASFASTLLRQPLIQREAGSASRQCFEDALRPAGHLPSEIGVAMEPESNEAIKEALLPPSAQLFFYTRPSTTPIHRVVTNETSLVTTRVITHSAENADPSSVI